MCAHAYAYAGVVVLLLVLLLRVLQVVLGVVKCAQACVAGARMGP